MIGLPLIFAGITLATLLPAFAALYIVSLQRTVPVRYLAAAAVGIAFWFFFDTMGDAGSLEENNSLYPLSLFGGAQHIILILSFVAGVAVLAAFDSYTLRAGKGSAGAPVPSSRPLFLIPFALALVMGIHTLGEGWDAASAAYAPASTTSIYQAMIQAFGNVSALASYPIHKFLEATIIGVAYAAYVRGAGRWWDIPVLGLLFAGPSAIGVLLGYTLSFDTSYLFAFGVSAAIYAVIRLVEPMAPGFRAGVTPPNELGTKAFVALTVGFLLLYTAALLH